MSERYTTFCHCISSMNTKEREWCRLYLKNKLRLQCSGCAVVHVDQNLEDGDFCPECKDRLYPYEEDEMGPLPGFRWEIEGTNLYLESNHGGTDQAIQFLEDFVACCRPLSFQALEWSHSAEEFDVGANGGGAAFITAKQTKTISTQEFLHKEQKKWDSSAGSAPDAATRS